MTKKSEEVYLDLLQEILDKGVIKKDRTGTGTISVFGKQIRFNMSEGFPLLTTKKIFTNGVIHELLWFLRGETNIKYLVDNGVMIWVPDAYKKYCNEVLNPLPKEEFIYKIKNDITFAKLHGELGPIYGSQWRKFGTNPLAYKGFNGDVPDWYDQIAEAFKTLKENPDSRRILVSAWNPKDLDKMTLPPCHYAFQFYTRELTTSERLDNAKIPLEFVVSGREEALCEALNLPKRAISLMWNQRSVNEKSAA